MIQQLHKRSDVEKKVAAGEAVKEQPRQAIRDTVTGVNATICDRYLPFSCPLDAFFNDAVRFPPFHRH